MPITSRSIDIIRRIPTLSVVVSAIVLIQTCEGFALVDRSGARTLRTRHDAVRPGGTLASETRFPDKIIGHLDLIPLLRGISDHAGTRRGRQALLALVGQDFELCNNTK
jgi:hypothetical protein